MGQTKVVRLPPALGQRQATCRKRKRELDDQVKEAGRRAATTFLQKEVLVVVGMECDTVLLCKEDAVVVVLVGKLRSSVPVELGKTASVDATVEVKYHVRFDRRLLI